MINRNIDGYVSKIKRHYGINQSTGYARVPCPFHNGTDKNFSIQVETGTGKCWSQCGGQTYRLQEILERLGFDPPERYTESENWIYRVKNNLKFRQRKYINGTGKKAFITEHQDSKTGKWKSGKGNIGKALSLPYQDEQISQHDVVYIVEGEKCVRSAQAYTNNLVITSAGGSSSAHKTDWSSLADKEIIFIPDCDQNGYDYVNKIASLLPPTESIEVIQLEPHDGFDGTGYDIDNYLERFPDTRKIEDLKRVEYDLWSHSTSAQNPYVTTKDRKGVEKCLRTFGIKIRHCVLKQKHQFKIDDGHWLSFEDIEIDSIKTDIEEKFTFLNPGGTSKKQADWSDRKWNRYINRILKKNIVNSFCVDYLDHLPKWNPDTMFSSERLFVDALGAEDTALNRTIGRMVIQAIVERAYLPTSFVDDEIGVKFDYLPILIGTQEGEGKSSFCEHLLPFPSMYGNRFNFAEKVTRQQESIRGKAVIEVNELLGIDRAQIEALKALLSISKEPQVRKAFAKNETEALRRCVFIGTTNDDTPIPMTGTRNRRFIPIVVGNNGREYVVRYLEEHRDQFFAHGIHCMKNKESLFLSKDLEKKQAAVVFDSTSKDEDEETALKNFYDIRKSNNTPFFTMADFINSLYDCNSDVQKIKTLQDRHKWRLSKLFKHNGFKKKQTTPKGHKRAVYWFKPANWF